MLAGNVPGATPAIVALPPNSALLPGQNFTALVRAQNEGLLLQLGAQQIPLPEGVALVAGQRVAVRIIGAGEALRLEITPQPAAPAPAAAAPGLETLLRPVLQALGKLDLASRASGLVPQHLPPSPASLQPLLTVLLSNQGPGRDLQQLQQILAAATAAGTVPADLAASVAQWLGLAPAAENAWWRGLLERARAERAAATRIAQSLGSGKPAPSLAAARDGAASLATRLLADTGFETWLREQGGLEPFRALEQRLQDRAQGGDLQNLRALNQPYQFLELPLREGDGFLRAHVHSFSDGKRASAPDPDAVHRTILDLETTQLGPLWIAIQAAGSQCACRFRTIHPDVVELVQAEAAGLREALVALGYQEATVSAESWDGNRDEAVLHLFAPYRKLDLEG